MNYCKTIYKKDTKKNIRYLTVNVNFDKLQQISGIMNTINPVVHEKICKPKNIGKSNETSGNEQAIKEAKALIIDKLTKGYFETVDEALDEEVILPMLAKDYKKECHKLDYSDIFNCQLFVQPKLDGMRCLAHISLNDSGVTNVILKSRDGKVIENMMHIETDLMKLSTKLNPKAFPHILDGELYVHGEDFQTNMQYIKKYRPGKSEKIQFNIYDKINSEEMWETRRLGLKYIEGLAQGLGLKSLCFVQDHQVTSEKMMREFHSGYLLAGYEGTMIRRGSGLYKINGRSSDLLKYKDFLDIDAKIISIGPAENRPEWGRPIVEWNGKQFSCGTKMSHEEKKLLLINSKDYIGKTANIRYFELSNTGVPRFPIMIGIHEDR